MIANMTSSVPGNKALSQEACLPRAPLSRSADMEMLLKLLSVFSGSDVRSWAGASNRKEEPNGIFRVMEFSSEGQCVIKSDRSSQGITLELSKAGDPEVMADERGTAISLAHSAFARNISKLDQHSWEVKSDCNHVHRATRVCRQGSML